MGPTRFPYGKGLGFVNNFFSNKLLPIGNTAVVGTAGDISGQTAPDVTLGELFYTNNTGALTITNFVLQDTANRLASYEGKVIRVFFLDANTQLANASPLVLSTTNNLLGANNTIELMQSRGSWFELNRSYDNTSDITNFITNAQSSLNVNGVRVALLNNTGSTTNSIIALSGGQVGQEVSFMLVGSNAVRLLAGGNIFMPFTNALLINASGMYKAMKFDNSSWRILAIGSQGGL